LLDTNILGRMAEPGHAQYHIALDATAALIRRGDQPCIAPQVLYEFWVVATRPKAVNGLGLTVAMAAAELSRLQRLFLFVPETPAVFAEWEQLVTAHQVSGKNAHDARLVAIMSLHGISHILTFNSVHFARYRSVTALEPAVVISAASP